MSTHDNERDDSQANEHFDEVDAVRRFPSEESWLDLPMPDLQRSDSPDAESSSESFTDRVMSARQEDLELDAQIDELDKALPTEVLRQFGTGEPSESFVDATVHKITEERRQRWQKMLSRHVAPEPSTKFVSRTLAALQEASGGTNQKAITSKRSPSPYDEAKRTHNRTVFGLVAAAAAALLWVTLTDDTRQPLALRLAGQTSPAAAYANSTSPMPAILARIASDEEPFAIFNEPADGLWLVSDTNREELR
jgi:hypothetical protein